jgi:ABC-type transporter Mla maintaining outer membrane lipid asymmetry ATPase subunit MlaF
MPAPNPKNSPAAPMIRMDGVTCGSMRDAQLVVARDVHWEVQRGDYWAIGGFHGSGKSDFLMMTAGLMPPREGAYQFLGESMPIFEPELLDQRLKLGIAFDGGQLFNHLTIQENVALPLRYHRNLGAAEASQQVLPWLEALQLGDLAASTPSAVGRNWQKRAGLARALVLRPELLLIDNPLGGLDPRQAAWWLGFLDSLARGHPLLDGKPLTLVAAVSDLRPWRGRARQFALLSDHRLLDLGSWEQVASASDALVREMLGPAAGGVDEPAPN